MPLVQTAQTSLQTANRRILVTGPRSSGKTLFSVSASRCAGDVLRGVKDPGKRIECTDTLLIQGDNEGVMGAVDGGLVPAYVLDMVPSRDWKQFQTRLTDGLRELEKKLKDGTIRVAIIDLGLPARLIDRAIDPATQKDWKYVAIEGARLFHLLSFLTGITVIGNCQIKAATSPGESPTSADASTAKALGGERSTFTFDLPKGIITQWLDNSSFVFAREAKRVRQSDGTSARTFRTLTQSSAKFEAKSRAESLLAPTEPGEKTLHSLLSTAYGENY